MKKVKASISNESIENQSLLITKESTLIVTLPSFKATYCSYHLSRYELDPLVPLGSWHRG